MMNRFNRRNSGGIQRINTASLPDIVFMLLFFFMVATTMRETEIKVKVKLPEATQVKKLEQKSVVSYIYIGRPVSYLEKIYGTEPLIQLNDKIIYEEGIPYESIQDYVIFEREQLTEYLKGKLTMSLRVDQDIPMGRVDDVKQALRKSNALIINYSAKKEYREKGRSRKTGS